MVSRVSDYTGTTDLEKKLKLRNLLRLLRARAKSAARREDPDLFRELDRRPRSTLDRTVVEAEERGVPVPSGVRR